MCKSVRLIPKSVNGDNNNDNDDGLNKIFEGKYYPIEAKKIKNIIEIVGAIFEFWQE